MEPDVTQVRYEHESRSVFGSVTTVTTVYVTYLGNLVSSVTERVECYQESDVIPDYKSRGTTVTGRKVPLSFRVPRDRTSLEHDLIKRFGFKIV